MRTACKELFILDTVFMMLVDLKTARGTIWRQQRSEMDVHQCDWKAKITPTHIPKFTVG